MTQKNAQSLVFARSLFTTLGQLQIIDSKMEQGNLLCETKDCGQLAKVFGLNGSIKIRSCESHMSLLLTKATKFFDISTYHFISSVQDVAVFDERKSLKEKGCGNLTVVEAKCDAELAAALKAIDSAKDKVIQSVESRFEEMKAAVTTACADAKKQLSQLRTEFEQLVASKESRLSPTAELLCADLSVVPLCVRFGLGDVSDQVSAVLSDCWTVNTVDVASTLKCLDPSQKNAAIKSALAEAAECAAKGIQEALRYAHLLAGEADEFEEEESKVISMLLEVEKRRKEENFKWLRRSWHLRQENSLAKKETAAVGQDLASCLCLHGQYSEAEQILRSCYSLAGSSELAISLCNALCGVYFARKQYKEVEETGKWVLANFASAKCPAKHYWTTLLYLAVSLKYANSNESVAAFLKQWLRLGFGEDCKLYEMLRILTSAVVCQEVKKKLKQVCDIGISHFPTSPFTALAFSYLARCHCGNAREVQYRTLAQSIWEVTAPKSAYAGENLERLGELYVERKLWSEAEKCYKQAQAIWELVLPKSATAALNSFMMGNLFEASSQEAQAIACFEQAASFFKGTGHCLKCSAERKIAVLRQVERK